MEKLTEEQIQILQQKKQTLFKKCTEIFKTRPYVEGLNEVYRTFDDSSITYLDQRGLYIKPLIESLLMWFYDLIQSPISPEEREMRINQSIFVCFLLYSCWQTECYRYFERYIAPFIIKPGSSTKQIAETLQKRFYDITHSAEAEEIEFDFLFYVMCIVVEVRWDNPKKLHIYPDFSRADDV